MVDRGVLPAVLRLPTLQVGGHRGAEEARDGRFILVRLRHYRDITCATVRVGWASILVRTLWVVVA